MKTIGTSKRLTLFFMFMAFCLAMPIHAQVTIGSGVTPNADALLDLKEGVGIDENASKKGLLLPRVALVRSTDPSPLQNDAEGMIVYNTATSEDVTPGIYYNDGEKWLEIGSGSGGENQFYMPSIVLPTDPVTLPNSNYTYTGSTFSVNLYNLYKEQYGLSSSTTSRKSAGAPALKVYDADQLYYYIIYFDNTVFNNVQISAAGMLSYQLVSGYTITEKTFMNILLGKK